MDLSPDQSLKISRFELLCCHKLFNWRQFKYYTKYSGQSTVTEQDLVVKYQVLEFTSFDCHQNHSVNRIQRSYYPFLSRGKFYGVLITTPETDAAS